MLQSWWRDKPGFGFKVGAKDFAPCCLDCIMIAPCKVKMEKPWKWHGVREKKEMTPIWPRYPHLLKEEPM